ncbi:amino acid permease [Longispora sp. K20-0274]|uniref:amino acid permease n=1 Tax=Longispora sp. K20-0274 TaxID=3088255 RepID=UPI00399C45A7
MATRARLRRSLSGADMVMFGLVAMVPLAPFGVFGDMYQVSGGMIALCYLAGAAVAVVTACGYAALTRVAPSAGSVYQFGTALIGRPVGFLGGWVTLLCYLGAPALACEVTGDTLTGLAPAVPWWVWAVAFVGIGGAVNCLGTKVTMRVIRVLLAAELFILAVVLLFGVLTLAMGVNQGLRLTPLYDPATFATGTVTGSLTLVVFAFIGFDGVSTLAEESRDGTARTARAIVLATLAAAAVFVIQSWVFTLFVDQGTSSRLLADGDPAGTALQDIATGFGGPLLAAGCTLALSLAMGMAGVPVQAAAARVLFAMARDGHLPGRLARLSPRRGVPVTATVVGAVVSGSCVGVLAIEPQAERYLGDAVFDAALGMFLLVHVCWALHLLRTRRRVALLRLAAPIGGAAVTGYLLYRVWSPTALVAGAWLLVGLAALGYGWLRRRRADGLRPGSAPSTREPSLGSYPFVWLGRFTFSLQGEAAGTQALVAVGYRHARGELLDLRLQPDDPSAWQPFLDGLVRRGLSGVRLVGSDEHAGLAAALSDALPDARWVWRLPPQTHDLVLQAAVETRLWLASRLRDLVDVHDTAGTRDRVTAFVGTLREDSPGLAEQLWAAREDLVAHPMCAPGTACDRRHSPYQASRVIQRHLDGAGGFTDREHAAATLTGLLEHIAGPGAGSKGHAPEGYPAWRAGEVGGQAVDPVEVRYGG